MVTSVVLSLLLAALTGSGAHGINPVQHSEGRGINPVQHSESQSSSDTTEESRGINPVQHSE